MPLHFIHRRGASLLELLVVLGIIGVLLALIIPAVQRVREAANLESCSNKLRQMAIAAHSFHADFNRLPPGYLGPSKANEADSSKVMGEGQWLGHLPMLLPYLHNRDAFLQLSRLVSFETEVVAQYSWFRTAQGDYPNAATYTLAKMPQPLFRCPSTPSYDVPMGVEGQGTVLGFHVYHSTRTGNQTLYQYEMYGIHPQYYAMARAQYIGVAGAGTGNRADQKALEGVYTNRSRTSLGQLATQDGTSNTLMYGESSGSRGRYRNTPRSIDISWVGAGALGTYHGLERGAYANVDTFASFHPSGVNFAFADGSVRTLRHGLYFDERVHFQRWHVLQQLGGMRDGNSLLANWEIGQ